MDRANVTPYGAPLLLAVVVVIVVAAVMISLRASSRRSELRFGEEPAPITLSGRGTYATKPLDFRAGRYRADYQFAEEWATAVYLISATTGDRDMLLYKTGAGSATFIVEADERAVVQVEPTTDHLDWQIELIPLRILPPTS